MNTQAVSEIRVFDPAATAADFVLARRSARALTAYPGPLPGDLNDAYACQDRAIGLWGEPVVGWKVGRIAPALQPAFGAERLIGPVFAGALWSGADATIEFPVFVGGFAAVEAEYVVRLGRDAPVGKLDWTPEAAADLVGDLMIAVETAGSPLATINDLGPAVVVSDFGNNAGLILGAPIRDWRERLDALLCVTFVDGVQVGSGGAASLPGGPLEGLRFCLELCARRGRPLKAGDLVSTGAATGIHDVRVGDVAVIDFGPDGAIRCRAIPAEPV